MSKADPAGALAKLLDDVVKVRMEAMNVAFPCRVVSFDQTKGAAVVQPLIQTGDTPPAVLQGVQVLGQKLRMFDGTQLILWPDIQEGDIVYVVCADRHMGAATVGQINKVQTFRSHSRNDAVIVGVFPCSLQNS